MKFIAFTIYLAWSSSWSQKQPSICTFFWSLLMSLKLALAQPQKKQKVNYQNFFIMFTVYHVLSARLSKLIKFVETNWNCRLLQSEWDTKTDKLSLSALFFERPGTFPKSKHTVACRCRYATEPRLLWGVSFSYRRLITLQLNLVFAFFFTLTRTLSRVFLLLTHAVGALLWIFIMIHHDRVLFRFFSWFFLSSGVQRARRVSLVWILDDKIALARERPVIFFLITIELMQWTERTRRQLSNVS